MRFRGLDMNHLVTLETLLSERSLTRAAERHFLTQPAISNALTKLREYFGDELLTRHGREMERTPFAETLLPPLRVALAQLQAVVRAKPSFDPSKIIRTLQVLTSDYVAQVMLPELIRHFAGIAPHVAIVHNPMSAEAVVKFAKGEIDAMIAPLGRHEKTPYKLLYVEKWVCVVRSGNSGIGDSISVSDYYRAAHVSPSYKHYIMDTHWQPPTDVVVRPATQLPFSAIPVLVAQTDYVALLPDRLVTMYEQQLNLRRVRTDPELPSVQMIVQWNPEFEMDAFLMWALDQMTLVGARLI